MIEFWSCDEGDEYLTHSEISECLADYWDQHEVEPGEIVEVYGFAPMKIPDYLFEVLSGTLERLNADFGNDYYVYEPSQRLLDAEAEFIRVLKDEYDPRSLELAKIIKVRFDAKGKWTVIEGDSDD